MFKIKQVLLFWFGFTFIAHSIENNILIDDNFKQLNLESKMTILKDNNYKPENILEPEIQDLFRKFDKTVFAAESDYWIRLKIINTLNEDKYILSGWPKNAKIEAYKFDPNLNSLENLKLENINKMFIELNLKKGKNIILLKVKDNRNWTIHNLELATFLNFSNTKENRNLYFGYNIGMFVFSIFFAFIIYLIFREKLALYSFFNFLFLLLSFAYHESNASNYLVIGNPWTRTQLFIFFNIAFSIFIFLLAKNIVNLKRNIPLNYKLTATILFLYVTIAILQLFGMLSLPNYFILRNHLLFLFNFVLLMGCLYLLYILKRNDKMVAYFAITRLPTCLRYFLAVLRIYAGFNVTLYMNILLYIAPIFEIIFFNLAIIRKIGLFQINIRQKLNEKIGSILANKYEIITSSKACYDEVETSTKEVLQIAKQVLPFDMAAVFAPKDDGIEAIFSYSDSNKLEMTDEIKDNLKNYMKLIEKCKLITCNNFWNDPILSHNTKMPKEVASIIIIPMSINSTKANGAIILISSYFNVYGQDIEAFALYLSTEIANLIQHFFQLYDIGKRFTTDEVEDKLRLFHTSSTKEFKDFLMNANVLIEDLMNYYLEKYSPKLDNTMISYLKKLENKSKEAKEIYCNSLALAEGEPHSDFTMNYLYEQPRTLRDRLKEENIKLIEHYEAPANLPIRGPKRVLNQLFIDLMLNSIEAFDDFKPRGSEKIIRIHSYIDNKGTLNFTIYDNGKGIKEEHMDKLFGPFTFGKLFRVGKGLMNAKKTVETLKGDISIRSKTGEGTEVHFTLDIISGSIDNLYYNSSYHE